MKEILIVGNFNWYFYEEALIDGFDLTDYSATSYVIPTLGFRERIFNNKKLKEINRDFYQLILEKIPDCIFLYRVNELFSSTIHKIQNNYPSIKIICYHNDNPFKGMVNKIKFYNYLQIVPICDIVYVYRPSNLLQAKRLGARNVNLFYPYYCTKIHDKGLPKIGDKTIDVVFIGHYENNRADYINYLYVNSVDVKIYGPGWERAKAKFNWPSKIVNAPVFGDAYSATIAKSKFALCFLSRINDDVYTRRNFEIPMAVTAVISERTKELQDIFIDKKEILLFDSKEELLDKIQNCLGDNDLIKKISEAGYKKVKSLGFSENDRARQIITDITYE